MSNKKLLFKLLVLSLLFNYSSILLAVEKNRIEKCMDCPDNSVNACIILMQQRKML